MVALFPMQMCSLSHNRPWPCPSSQLLLLIRGHADTGGKSNHCIAHQTSKLTSRFADQAALTHDLIARQSCDAARRFADEGAITVLGDPAVSQHWEGKLEQIGALLVPRDSRSRQVPAHNGELHQFSNLRRLTLLFDHHPTGCAADLLCM